MYFMLTATSDSRQPLPPPYVLPQSVGSQFSYAAGGTGTFGIRTSGTRPGSNPPESSLPAVPVGAYQEIPASNPDLNKRPTKSALKNKMSWAPMQRKDVHVSNMDPNCKWSTDDRASGRFGVPGGQLGAQGDHQSSSANGRIGVQQTNALA